MSTGKGRVTGAGVNPTVVLCVASLLLFYGSLTLFWSGEVGIAAAMAMNTVALYSMYSVSHDAIHDIASGNRTINGLLGRVCAFHEGMTYPIFKVSHMMHHRYTNHPVMDPDYVIGRKPRVLFPLWVVVRLLHDNGYMIKTRLWRGKRKRLAEHLLTVVAQVAFFAALAALFGAGDALLLWIVPVAIAGASVEMLVAWLVHYPQESQHKFEHTRLIRSRVLQVLMFNHNLHVVHHLWPRTPWYAYPQRVDEAERLLKDHAVRTAANARNTSTKTTRSGEPR